MNGVGMSPDSISQWITLIGAASALVLSVLNFFANKKKLDVDTNASTIKNAKDIQDMYEKAFDEFETRWTKRLQDQEGDCEKKINGVRHSLEEDMRQKLGEHLVKIEELQQRNQDLKVQIAELGGVVEGSTGLKIHQWSTAPTGKK